MKYTGHVNITVEIDSDRDMRDVQAHLSRLVSSTELNLERFQVKHVEVTVREPLQPFPGIAGPMEKLGELLIKKLGEGDEPWQGGGEPH